MRAWRSVASDLSYDLKYGLWSQKIGFSAVFTKQLEILLTLNFKGSFEGSCWAIKINLYLKYVNWTLLMSPKLKKYEKVSY